MSDDNQADNFRKANSLMRAGNHSAAINLYQQILAKSHNELLNKQINFNLRLALCKQKSKKSSHSASSIEIKRNTVLYIVHDGGGGMIHTSFDLLKSVSQEWNAYLLQAGKTKWILHECVDKKIKIKNSWEFKQDWSAIADLDKDRILVLNDLINSLTITLVHVRVLFGSGTQVIEICERQSIPVVFSFHDFSAICPNIQLISDGRFCRGKCDTKQENDCSFPKKWISGVERLKNSYRHQWGEKNQFFLNKCDAYIVTSKFTHEIFKENFHELADDKFHVIEHGRDFPQRANFAIPYRPESRCDVVFFGALNEAKGCKLVGELLKINKTKKGPFRFHIIGNIFNERYRALFSSFKEAVLYGSYEREDVYTHFKKIRPTLVILPSIWPETYSHVLTESWAYGVPVLGSSLGAIGDRIEATGGGWNLPPDNAVLWFNAMQEIVTNSHDYREKLEAIKHIEIKSIEKMTSDYLSVYARILANKSIPRQYVVKNQAKKKLSSENSGTVQFNLNQESKIKQIRIKMLEFGFFDRAIQELDHLANNSNNETRASAKWELALWYASKNSAEAAKQSLDYLLSIEDKSLDLNSQRALAIMQAECFLNLKMKDEAHRCLNQILEKGASADLFFACANLESSFAEKLSWVNRAFELNDISPLTAETADCDYNSLEKAVLKKPFAVTDDMAKITVIVPVFNAGQTISMALNSILNQTWRNIEVIVVDDCSTDDSRSVVKKYANQDDRIRLFQTPVNSGPYVARNIALAAATGDYVTCHDADDWSHPDKLHIQVKHLIENKEIYGNISHWARIRDDFAFFRRGNRGYYAQPNLSSLMLRREALLNDFGFWDSVRFGADTELVSRINKAKGKQAITDLPGLVLSFARTLDSSLTENKTFGYPGYPFGIRREYRESYLSYYNRSNPKWRIEFPQEKRNFMAPRAMLTNDVKGSKKHFETVIIADWRDPAQIEYCVELIRQRQDLHERIALLHLPCYNLKVSMPVDIRIRDFLDNGEVELLVFGDEATADRLIIRHPRVLQEKNSYIPIIKTLRTNVLIDRVQSNNIDGVIDIKRCAQNLKSYFKADSAWYLLHQSDWERGCTVFPKDTRLPFARQSDFPWFKDVEIIDVKELSTRQWNGPKVIIVIPCIDLQKGVQAARVLLGRAGMECRVLVIMDSIRQGFIKTFNDTASCLQTDYVVYCAQDAYPGRNWLRIAYETITKNDKGLLSFNDGKWRGRIASFGMIKLAWVKSIYPSNQYLFGGYKSHKADNEITVIARALNQFVYESDSVLTENDLEKDYGGSNLRDDNLFEQRFRSGFGGIIPTSSLVPLAKDYYINNLQ